MKNSLIVVVVSALALGAFADASFPSIGEPLKRVRRAYEASRKVLECPSHIRWDGDDAFVYSTRSAKGDVSRRFTVSTSNLVDIARAQLDEVWKQKREEGVPRFPRHKGFVRPSGTYEIKTPDGRWTAFCRDCNIWVKSKETGEFQLSFDGTQGEPYIDMMWSPDSKKLAAMRERRVVNRKLTLIESSPADSVHPRMKQVDYAKPGDVRFSRTVALFLPEERRQVKIDLSDWVSQYEVLLDCWTPDSSKFTFTYVDRGFTKVRLGAVDAPSGRVHALAEESSDKFVFHSRIKHWWLQDGKRFLWKSRRSGYYHLYLVSAEDGSQRQITSGDWNVRELVRIDESRGILYLMANGFAAAKGEDPYHMHLLRVELATGKVGDLTPENANHIVNLNRSGKLFLDYYGSIAQPPRFVVRDANDGHVVAELPKVDVSGLSSPDFPRGEPFCAKGRDGKTDIWGVIWRPLDFNPSKRYPVVEFIYAGPHDSFVPKDYAVNPPRGIYLLADGFVVVQIDGMGTENRSREFHEVCWRNLKDAGFPDRIPWMKAAAATRPWMDLSRVGVYGYSAGGQNAMGALLFHGDFYKAAVSLCGCHDNRVDKLWWNEQWMGYPLGPWYAENSNVVNAHKLKGDLLLINGELDDNVDPVSTLQVVNALFKAKKNFEQLYLPGHGHNLGDEYIGWKILDFFHRKLK